MKIGDLVKIKDTKILTHRNEWTKNKEVDVMGVVIELRTGERNRQRIIYCKVLLGDNSLYWFAPEKLEAIG